ncbi:MULTISPECIES: hypothetical protein [Alkalihalophilus]|uniref:Uncharacterized protein n=2 Tax=Alkalihalophilus pseudofirmus TaxID=79885 RepID=D3FUS0_ALKPO|nr:MULTISPECIES: hypothetical protein [Alkalihalophilus]ADC48346.1 hypothetical protein BpOF4_01390 [Alkalihalophilus pseudofirmus OF4]MDV2885525.1 hypothetical protein [Alkalihalophilus pseudofirmus]MEC2073860.1 hypothetical protein [Alkalihalophilus marmarensis]MED1601154.1 hypothetical protein [Alkalihalophilus marmarensis]OLS39388.1 hypothetical protein BTR22_00440 [Alkalihalophilus pseudofirmus]
MQSLYEQIQVYLNMEEEIPFKEFNSYYQKVIKELGDSHEQFDEETLWKALFIVENVMSNAEGRAKETKGTEAKKYTKMAQRLQLWAKNFATRLGQAGYTEEDINERFNTMFEEGAPANS